MFYDYKENFWNVFVIIVLKVCLGYYNVLILFLLFYLYDVYNLMIRNIFIFVSKFDLIYEIWVGF